MLLKHKHLGLQDSDAIAAARQAGIDQVLARSAFTAQLGTILQSA